MRSNAAVNWTALWLFLASIAGALSQCVRKPSSDVCHYVYTHAPAEKESYDKCVITSCQDRLVNMSVVDKNRGKIEISLNAVSAKCNLTRYHISLLVLDRPETGEPRPCQTKDSDWAVHSRRDIFVEYCQPDDNDCRNRSTPCSQVHKVSFQYVFTSWYQVKVTPHVGSSTWQSQISQPVFLETNYDRKTILDLNKTVASLQFREEKNDSRVSFLFDSELDWDNERSFRVSLRLLTEVNGSLGSAACYGSGQEHSCCTFYGKGNETTVDCSVSIGQSTPECRATRYAVHCLFTNMAHGNVCAVLTFHDDRCEPGTIWTAPDNRPCQWQSYKEFYKNPKKIAEESFESHLWIYLVSIFAAILAISIIFVILFKRLRTKKRQRLPTENYGTDDERQRFNFDELANRHFSLIDQLTLTERPRPEVLLVYSHDIKPFMELVACLRRVLDKICKCRVYDYFDEEYKNMISIDPEGWVRSLIVHREAKVIIIANQVGAMRHRALIETQADVAAFKNPHCFDHLFTYAMKLLRDVKTENTYKNHFVVTFDGYTENNQLLEYFNPYMRFVLPKHLNKLFEHLHDSNKTVHFETSRQLEERYEVRQLRLQLERLINLTLLTKSDLTNQKIYDWE